MLRSISFLLSVAIFMQGTIFFTRYLWLLGENFNSIVDSNPRPCPWNKSLVIKSMIQLNRSEPMDSYSLSNVIRCKPEPELGICVCRWDNNFISKRKKNGAQGNTRMEKYSVGYQIILQKKKLR